jgi:hypothetical protein
MASGQGAVQYRKFRSIWTGAEGCCDHRKSRPGTKCEPQSGTPVPSLFQAIHGSAFELAVKNEANPIASIWSAQMMLEFLGETELATLLMHAIEGVLRRGKVRTRDLGGHNSRMPSVTRWRLSRKARLRKDDDTSQEFATVAGPLDNWDPAVTDRLGQQQPGFPAASRASSRETSSLSSREHEPVAAGAQGKSGISFGGRCAIFKLDET